MTNKIPFNSPYRTGKELTYIAEAGFNRQLAGDGQFTKRCHAWLESQTGAYKALLTHSCTAALELAALLLDIEAGDEIIMPSYTFVSTANAFVLRGAVPVFVDVRPDTLNLDEDLLEEAITERTRVIVPVHYAGVACNMEKILTVAARHSIRVVEDAAQAIMSTYKGRPLGTFGDLGALSFHETKNIISGEGGALLVNDPGLAVRAEIIREKGTDRSRFFRGEVDKYTWQEVGSSFLPGELIAAFLWAQMEQAEAITRARIEMWNRYHMALQGLESQGLMRRPIVPPHCGHNAHMYYVLLGEEVDREAVLREMKQVGVSVVFHYVPLHSSPAGRRYGRTQGALHHTEQLADRLIRLPLWLDMTATQQDFVVERLQRSITNAAHSRMFVSAT
ncbi:dTDP-4-amino-4,6-dideoxygalactose transaminase [Bordetella bronchialis]|uniref:dTDP-4-amino-4,6-dideoxygalactose transaminase n=1 Tax=Bordetella bronchialis TaxID=463025 RepID=A0A193FHV8_9BORD|nr:dTDP-4-amino-4,6-dideoxygalactose transaminase [Bordetella bronchialis]ANN66776.1 dTDP-4-amino-4,6-dideoxygalactose transaminase [Bordetella bronchialis]ANN71853.1 dTDP-4-amino-4,6-dideoxygalactose transaminase [Bordetella bronchialis]